MRFQPLSNCHAQAGAFCLGREERIEDVLALLGVPDLSLA
jgi:hypothetical protein